MALKARLAALYLSGWPWVLRQSVCSKTAAVRSHSPLLHPGSGAPLPRPGPGGLQRAPARLGQLGRWKVEQALLDPALPVLGCLIPAWGPRSLFLYFPGDLGSSDVLSAWDTDLLSTGHMLPLAAQLGSCHVDARVCMCVGTCVCPAPFTPMSLFCPMRGHLRARAIPGSPLGPLCPQNGDRGCCQATPGPGQPAEGCRLGGGNNRTYAWQRSGRHGLVLRLRMNPVNHHVSQQKSATGGNSSQQSADGSRGHRGG